MSVDAIITLVVIFITLFLFLKEFFPVDLVALGVIVVLVISGVITVDQGRAGFSNQATLTVAAMFVLSHAIIQTQIIQHIAPRLSKLFEKSYTTALLGLSLLVGMASAFVNNTPIVATFIPVINSSSRKAQKSPSRFLMPLSFIAIFGGTCTLVGTSTNILVAAMAEDRGVDDFEMFTMLPFGVILFTVGTLYLILFGKNLIPERTSTDELKEQEGVHKFIAEVRLRESLFDEEGDKSIEELLPDDLEVKAIYRDEKTHESPSSDDQLQKDDVLLIEGNLSKIRKLISNEEIKIRESSENTDFPDHETQLHEIVILPNSDLEGQKLKNVPFLKRYESKVIAIRQRGKKKFDDLQGVQLKAGDVLVLLSNKNGSNLIEESQKEKNKPFLSLNTIAVNALDKKKLIITLTIITALIILVTTGIVKIVIAAFGAMILLCALGVIEIKEAYKAIDWKVIFLLAGSLSLGKAMSESGLSDQIGHLITHVINNSGGSMLVVAIFYLITSILTEMISNNASVALMVPIAFSAAESMGVDVTPILLTIAFAGSASFMTPIGYQTNTMIYSAGNFKFSDFAKVGTPLNIIFLILASLLIPLIYPF